MRIEYYSNNSGGRDWLTAKQWAALKKAGWAIRGFSSDLIRDKRPRYAVKSFPSMKAALEEFEQLTGHDVSDEGCNCCGPPHEFHNLDGVLWGKGFEVPFSR